MYNTNTMYNKTKTIQFSLSISQFSSSSARTTRPTFQMNKEPRYQKMPPHTHGVKGVAGDV